MALGGGVGMGCCIGLGQEGQREGGRGHGRRPAHPNSGTTGTSPAEQRAWSGSHIVALTASHPLSHSHKHTHTVLVHLSGCCLLSVWLGSLCLSACPPHKPNNAALLRLWLPAQWKKKKVDEEEEVMKEEGEMESEE